MVAVKDGARRAPGRAVGGEAELEARITELELECAVLKELVRDPKSEGPARLSSRLKTDVRREAEAGDRVLPERGLPGLADLKEYVLLSAARHGGGGS